MSKRAGRQRRVGLMRKWGGHNEAFRHMKWYWALVIVVPGRVR